MKTISKKTKNRLTVIGATSVTIFSLASLFTGTYSWFMSNRRVEIETDSFAVTTLGSATLESLELIKFDYHYDTIEDMKIYDYLTPANGAVNKYYYNEEYAEGNGSFGKDDNGTFVPIDNIMNVYDPFDRIIRGGELISLNCNVIYVATFTSTLKNTYLQLIAERLLDKETGNNEILLSDCTDIDVYFESDLEYTGDTYSSSSTYEVNSFTLYNSYLYRCIDAVESAEEFDNNKWEQIAYYSQFSSYPINSCVFYEGEAYTNIVEANNEAFSHAKWQKVNTYSSSSTYNQGTFVIYDGHPYICNTSIETGEDFNVNKWDAALCHSIYYPSYKSSGYNVNDEIYYKTSYLSSLEARHSNFYNDKPKKDKLPVINNKNIVFPDEEELQTVYVNVNYAPSQADLHIRSIHNTIRAIYDYVFDFQFLDGPVLGE